MAIKVRHDGNNAAVITAGVGSGRAKRRVETAKFAQNTPQHIQTLQPAHASAPGVGGGSAPLTHAPNGASGASAPLTHAPTPTVSGGAGTRSSLTRGSAGADLGEVKVTGNSIFTRPDKESQWNPSTLRWERPYLPGEKEAEAAQRMNPVLAEREQDKQDIPDAAAALRGQHEMEMLGAKSQQERDLFDYKLSQKQKMEISAVTDAVDNARRSGRFTPEEMEDIERQATVKLMGIKPLPTPREKDAQKAFNERIVTAGGVQGYINSKGDFEPFQKDDGFANFLKVYPKLAEYTEDTTTTDPATGKTMIVPVTKTRTADEIAALVKGAQEAWNRAKPQDTAMPGSAPAAPAADPLDMLFPWSRAMLATGPFAPPSPAPAPPSPAPEKPFTGVAKTPDDAKKKWGVTR